LGGAVVGATAERTALGGATLRFLRVVGEVFRKTFFFEVASRNRCKRLGGLLQCFVKGGGVFSERGAFERFYCFIDENDVKGRPR
jgi:hypothetical protein